MDEIQNEIIRVTGISDYEKGLNYDEDYIKYVGVTDFQNKKKFQFLVHSESSSSKYLVQVFVDYKHISSTFCTCPRFYQNDTCKHVAACLITYSNIISGTPPTRPPKILFPLRSSNVKSSSLVLPTIKLPSRLVNWAKLTI